MPKRKANKVDEEDEKKEEQEQDSGSDTSNSGGSSSEGSSSSGSDDDDGFPDVSDKGEDEDDEDDEEGGEKQDEIVIHFEFFPPKEIDFHGLKSLLLTYLDGQQYDSSGLVNSILKQEVVGTVVKTAEDDDPIAVFTVLNTQTHKDQEWLKDLRLFLASKTKDAAQRKQMEEAFAAPGTGLLLNERLINCPPKLAPPLMQFLFEEIKGAATDKKAPKTQREEFEFKRFLVATRVYADNERGADEAGPSTSQHQPKKAKIQPGEPVIVYLRPEDEFLHQSCVWSYTFPVEGKPVTKDDLQPLRMVMLVEAQKIPGVRKALDAVVENMAAGH